MIAFVCDLERYFERYLEPRAAPAKNPRSDRKKESSVLPYRNHVSVPALAAAKDAGAKSPRTDANRLELVGIYAHEINNHLTVILGSCDMAMNEGAPNKEVVAYLAEIRTSALAIARLAKGLEPLQH
jgi:hypothetical protein